MKIRFCHFPSQFLGMGFLFFFLCFSCTPSTPKLDLADLIVVNGQIYTVDAENTIVEAIAIKGDRILATGTIAEMEAFKGPDTETLDLEGQSAYPGFIEGHGHFSGIGFSLINLNLMKTKNWNEIVAMVAEKAKDAEPGEWIVGRGWHQEKWDETPDRQVLGYPYHDELSAVSPDNPVLLSHASGHSLFANAKAMEEAGVNKETPDPVGGLIVRDQNGVALGVFEERAEDIIYEALNRYRSTLSQEDLIEEWNKAIDLAEAECIQKGVTSFQDAGSSFAEIDRYLALADSGKLDLRLWVMMRESYEETVPQAARFPIIGYGNDYFTCRAIKSQVDGALGTYGAWLLQPYNDKPGFYGQNTTPISEVENMARLAIKNGLQLCVHAIGDRANREVIDIFANAFDQQPEEVVRDFRWRVEHAQHVNVEDIPRFAKHGIIASMQGVHCTSDAPFVEKRLGERRAREESYAWRSFLDSGAIIANGTDAPVEDVDPLASFYSSVTRQPGFGKAFFPEQSMTRVEALRSYTIDNAYAGFEESVKGSLEGGKLADLVVLSKDLVNCSDQEILEAEVLYTIIGGEIKYQK
ncbi:MAG: amidohydrolase [Bacteroidota bacterium]